MKINTQNLFRLFLIAAFLAAMFLVLSRAGRAIEGSEFQSFVQHAGVWAPFVVFLAYVLAIVFAPLTGFPLVILTVSLFGPFIAVFINLLAMAVGGTINFYISRLFGRKVLGKIVGKSGVVKVDSLVSRFGVDVLILTRLFQGFLFEWISYAAGLSKIPYKKYIFITIWASIPYNLMLYFFAVKISDLGQLYILFTGINYILLTVPPLYYFLKKSFSAKTK